LPAFNGNVVLGNKAHCTEEASLVVSYRCIAVESIGRHTVKASPDASTASRLCSATVLRGLAALGNLTEANQNKRLPRTKIAVQWAGFERSHEVRMDRGHHGHERGMAVNLTSPL
jgi:hypothetical protein